MSTTSAVCSFICRLGGEGIQVWLLCGGQLLSSLLQERGDICVTLLHLTLAISIARQSRLVCRSSPSGTELVMAFVQILELECSKLEGTWECPLTSIKSIFVRFSPTPSSRPSLLPLTIPSPSPPTNSLLLLFPVADLTPPTIFSSRGSRSRGKTGIWGGGPWSPKTALGPTDSLGPLPIEGLPSGC